MRYFELMESGLPAERFIVNQPVSFSKAVDANGVRRRVRFRPNSPWLRNRKTGERLTWRGRSFVEAFAEVNRRDIIAATFLELSAGKGHVPVDNWRQDNSDHERYHFICQTSEGAYLRVGEDRIQPEAGQLWRIDDRTHPAVLGSGSAGSLHLVLVLAQQECANDPKAAPLPEQYFGATRISEVPQRSLFVG